MRTKALAAPYIVWMVIFTVVPLAMVAYFAFTTNSGEFTFTNLTRAAEYMPVLLRSVWYALAACAICLVIGYPVAYVIAQTTARTQRVLYLLGCDSFQVFRRVILPLSVPGIVSGITMVFVPAVSTFYISQKLGGTNNTMIGDVIELQFKGSLNRNFGAAMSLVLMLLVFVSIWLMNRFTDDEEGVATI